MKQKKRRHYSQEFKIEAVKLITHQGYTIAEASRNLGVDYSVVRRWKNQCEQELQQVLPVKVPLNSPDEEIRRLKEKLAQVKEERDVFKKALAYFAELQK